MKVTILVDDRTSWFVPYAAKLREQLAREGMDVVLIHDKKEAPGGDISFLLSCVRIVGADFLEKYQHNIVVHASDLPAGKGFTPLKWQIREGKDEIVFTMFEAVEAVDAGPWYQKEKLAFAGTELLGELQEKAAEKIIDMCVIYAKNSPDFPPREQSGEESFYRRPGRQDDELDIDKTLREQINHLRTADNERFPAWFSYRGRKYTLKIYPQDEGGRAE